MAKMFSDRVVRYLLFSFVDDWLLIIASATQILDAICFGGPFVFFINEFNEYVAVFVASIRGNYREMIRYFVRNTIVNLLLASNAHAISITKDQTFVSR